MDTTTPSSERSPLRRRRRLRVGTVLLLVAAIPLAGTAWLTWSSVDDAGTVVDRATATSEIAQHAVALARLDSSLFGEMIWAAADAVATSMQVPVEVYSQVLGSDTGEQLRTAQLATDAYAAEAGERDLVTDLLAARAGATDLAGVVDGYGRVVAAVEATLTDVLHELSLSTVGLPDAAEVVDHVEVLELAVEARTSTGQQYHGYFAALFAVRDTPAVELTNLIELRRRYESAMTGLEAATAAMPELRLALDQLRDDPTIGELRTTVDELIARSLAGGLPARGADLDIATILENVAGFSAVLTAMDASSAATLRLLDAASAGVLGAAGDVQDDAHAEIRAASVTAALLTLTTLAAALVAARFIVLPLRGLRRAARDLQRNREGHPEAPRHGPAEVQAAAEAISDAAAHIDLVSRQARALAAGDLDAPVLDEDAPGGLGDALHDAVGTLRTALTQQDEFRRRLAHEAAHDGLTQLANRNASMAQLTRSLARTQRSGSQLAVLFIDLDRFKDINDRHGHQVGDAVLAGVAQRLVNSVREGDHVGRLGGDEFVVIAEPVTGVHDAVSLAERVRDALDVPFDLAVGSLVVGASIGIAIAEDDDLSADELLRDADLAVYRAKGLGRGGIEVCNEDLRQEMAETADLTVAIRHAIDDDELVLHYQPIVETRSEHTQALEALVRWRRPGHPDLLPPERFITFAERNGLIVDLDRWVIEHVAAQMATWREDPRWVALPVAINVSGRHLADEQFVEHVLEPLARHGVDPHGIIVEVTEGALLDDLAGAAVKLQRLREHGVLVSIDDFGTGYTSLAHLRSLPVDILKIDRAFTAGAAVDSHEASIVKLIIDTGHLLGATITAEGIETIAEAEELAGLGTDNLQGFFYARPQPPERLTTSFEHPR